MRVRVLPNRINSSRSSERVRKGPHARSHLVWQILFGSLVLDPMLPMVLSPPLPVDAAVLLGLLCALAALPFLAQRTVHRALSSLRVLHSKSLSVGSRALPITLAVSVGMVLILKVLMFSQVPRGILLLILAVVAWSSRKFITQVGKQTQDDKALFSSNPWAKVQRWEHQVIVFAILPLALARMISVAGALADLPADAQGERIIFIAVSAIFLGMLQPDRSFFIGTCKTCQRPVPIVFQDIGSCLSCDMNLRFAYHAWVHKIPPPVREEAAPQNESSQPKKI